jgi:hypothetical protein
MESIKLVTDSHTAHFSENSISSEPCIFTPGQNFYASYEIHVSLPFLYECEQGHYYETNWTYCETDCAYCETDCTYCETDYILWDRPYILWDKLYILCHSTSFVYDQFWHYPPKFSNSSKSLLSGFSDQISVCRLTDIFSGFLSVPSSDCPHT